MDIVVRSFAVALTLALAALAVRSAVGTSRRGALTASWHTTAALLLLLYSTVGFAAQNTAIAANQLIGVPALVAFIGAKTFVGHLWVFGRAVFNDDFRFGLVEFGVIVVWAIVSFAAPSWVGLPVLLGLVGHLVWTTLHGRGDDMRDARRTARVWVVGVMIGALMLDVGADLVMGYAWRPPGFVVVQNAIIAAAALVGLLAFGRLDLPTAPSDRLKHAPERSRDAQRLHDLMVGERIYLDPALGLADVVARMPMGERAVRRLINHELGHGHFRTFLNGYRVEHAMGLLRDPERRGEKIIGVALDSGFASLASFQRAFKAQTGTTPTAWREAALTPARTPGLTPPAPSRSPAAR